MMSFRFLLVSAFAAIGIVSCTTSSVDPKPPLQYLSVSDTSLTINDSLHIIVSTEDIGGIASFARWIILDTAGEDASDTVTNECNGIDTLDWLTPSTPGIFHIIVSVRGSEGDWSSPDTVMVRTFALRPAIASVSFAADTIRDTAITFITARALQSCGSVVDYIWSIGHYADTTISSAGVDLDTVLPVVDAQSLHTPVSYIGHDFGDSSGNFWVAVQCRNDDDSLSNIDTAKAVFVLP